MVNGHVPRWRFLGCLPNENASGICHAGEPPPIAVFNAAGTRRCLEYRATTDADWLTLEPDRGLVPGQLRLIVDRASLGGGATHAATVTVTVDDPDVLGSPQHIRVTVLPIEVVGMVYLPAALQREDIRSSDAPW